MDQTGAAPWRAIVETLNRSLQIGLAPAEARAFQQRNLARLAGLAHQRSAFYRPRLAPVMGRSGLRIERWTDIPILTKDQLRANREQILIADPGVASGAVRMGWTSGSEGEPLHYARTALADFVSSQNTQRFMRWWKMDGNQRLAHITAVRQRTDEQPKSSMRRGWLHGHPTGEIHTFAASTDLTQQLSWLQSIRPAYLKSYPEVLGELARLTLRQGRMLPFKLVIAGGGVLGADVRKLCREAFGCAVADVYGAEEIGGIAAECPVCGEFHVADENVLLEILTEDGRPARPGETGRAVVTTLFNDAFPLIRYQIGDHVEAGGGAACRQPLQAIRRVLGRSQGNFRLRGGRIIWPYIPQSEIGRLENVRRFQFVQVAEDQVEFHYVPRDPQSGIDQGRLESLVAGFIDPSLAVKSVAVARIERDGNFKYMLYRSLLTA